MTCGRRQRSEGGFHDLGSPEAGRVESGKGPPLEPPGRARGPVDTLVLDSWPPELEGTHFCGFKPPSLWQLVTAAPGHRYAGLLEPRLWETPVETACRWLPLRVGPQLGNHRALHRWSHRAAGLTCARATADLVRRTSGQWVWRCLVQDPHPEIIQPDARAPTSHRGADSISERVCTGTLSGARIHSVSQCQKYMCPRKV